MLLDLKYRLEYLFLRAIIGFVRLFPLETAADFSARTWRKLAPKFRQHKRALANLERAFPDKSPEEREQIALAMWSNLGRVMVETMQLDRLIEDDERFVIEDQKVVDRYRGKMGSGISVSLHMGNWELAMLPLRSAGATAAGVYRLVKNPHVDAYLQSQRQELYPGGLFAKGRGARGKRAGHNAVRSLGNYVRDGGQLAFLADLYDAKGIEVPFFGHPARSTPFPAMLARRLGTRVWIGRCLRVGDQSRFSIHMKELRVPRSDDADADVRELTADIQAHFEAFIRANPEQWMWGNRKWS